MKNYKLILSLAMVISLAMFSCTGNNSTGSELDDPSDSTTVDQNGEVSSDSGDGSENSSSSVVTVCGFETTDSEWSYVVKTADATEEGTTELTYQIEGDNLVILQKETTNGTGSSMVCGLQGSTENVMDFYDDGSYIKITKCEGRTFIGNITITKEGFFANNSLEDFHATVVNSCKIANGLAEAPEISTAKLVTTCDFSVETDFWEYSYGDSSSYTTQGYVFDGEDMSSYRHEITAMDYAECLAITPIANENTHCIDAGLLKRSGSGTSVTAEKKQGFFDARQNDCKEYIIEDENDDELEGDDSEEETEEIE
ncbi:MAG: hypothetical protein GX801_04280 [Fibrobacter sp.]|nr:hypothetical protein [Fibrobacter sp.]